MLLGASLGELELGEEVGAELWLHISIALARLRVTGGPDGLIEAVRPLKEGGPAEVCAKGEVAELAADHLLEGLKLRGVVPEAPGGDGYIRSA